MELRRKLMQSITGITEGVHCDSKTSTRGPALQGMKAAVSHDVAELSLTNSMD